MKAKTRIVHYLRIEPKFRERKNKDSGIVNMLMRDFPQLSECIRLGQMSKDTVVAMVQSYATLDRAWRQALESDVSLRGSDYGMKAELENKKLEELGYNVNPNKVELDS